MCPVNSQNDEKLDYAFSLANACAVARSTRRNFFLQAVDDDTSILQHALYQYLLHYGLLFHVMSQYLWLFSLILQGLHEEGECWQLEFLLEKEQTLETYSAQLQKT